MINQLKTGEMQKLAAQSIRKEIDYEVTDKPEGGITNAQMQAALTTTEGFYQVGSVYTCTDDGEYTKKHLYKFNGADAALPWEDVTPVSEVEVDQEYDATSTNAQSGTAVAQAVATAGKTLITLTGESGTLTDAEIAKVIDDNAVVEFVLDGNVYKFSEKQTNYAVYSSVVYPTQETKEERVIYIQTASDAVNYKHWSLEAENGDKPIVTQNVKIQSGDWVSDGITGYSYSADIEVEGATDKDVSIVTFSESDADSGDFASVCDTTEDTVTIYSKTARDVTIPVVLTVKTNTAPIPLYAPIYGVEWTNDASTTMTRTDDAVGMTYTDNSGKFTSDFDNVFPYNQMRRTTIGSNVFVKIPAMWFRVGYDSDSKIVSVAVSETQGPAKTEAGVTYVWHQTKEFYYGAYGASSDGTVLKSVSGVSRLATITRAQARTRAMAVGTGYHQRDLYAGTVLMFLFWIEYANKASQKYPTSLGGVFPAMNVSDKLNTGGTDTIYNEIAGADYCVSGYVANNQMVWHGIEDLFGNLWEWEDGVTGNATANSTQYVSADYTKYEDYDPTTTPTNMNALSFNSPTENGYCLEALGWDNNNPFLVQPITVRQDSSYTTGFTDYASTSNREVSRRGSVWVTQADRGLSYFYRWYAADARSDTGCRLMYEGGV